MNRIKKGLAIALTLAMVISLLPLASFDSYAAKKPKISKKKITLVVGQKKKLKIKHKPKGVKVKWKSKNKKIAKVSKKGKVKALRPGKTKIIAKVGKKKYKCKVTVKAKGTVVPTKKVEPTAAPPATKAPVPTTKEVEPTVAPTTAKPTQAPTQGPTQATTQAPTAAPTQAPTQAPTAAPTQAPTQATTSAPTQAPTQATTAGPQYEWIQIGNGTTNPAGNKLYYAKGTDVQEVVNVQRPPLDFVKEDGVYVNAGAAINSVTVNGNASQSAVQGGGTWIYLSELTQNINSISIDTVGGVKTLLIKNENAGGDTPTQAPTGGPTEQPTQPVDPTLPDVVGLTYSGNPDLPFYFAWAASTDVDGYHVYVNGNRVTDVTASAVNLDSSLFPTSGTYTIGVQAFKGTAVSKITSIDYKYSGGSTPTQATTQAPTQAPTQGPTQQQPTTKSQQSDFEVDESLQKPFGIVVENPDAGIIQVNWGAGSPNCYNVYVDGVRKKTKVVAGVQRIPVQTEGNHTVAIATVSGNKESLRTEATIYVNGTAPEEVETTQLPPEMMPEIDESVQKEDGKMVLQLNNKTKGQYSDSQIYWIVLGINPSTGQMSYLNADGNLVAASSADNDGTIGNRSYSAKIVHTLAQKKAVQLPAITSGRMYISYGEPVYITFNGQGNSVGYAAPDVNNHDDANYHTPFEYLEFTTESVNGGITFHGNVTRVDFFSFPMIARLTDEYGAYDRCVGDMKTRSETFDLYRSTVSDPFKTTVTDERIMCPAKSTFGEGKQYANYYDDYINRFWNKYSNEDLVTSSEAGSFRGRVQNGRLVMSDGNGTYYIDKPSTQDVLEGRGAFNRISAENQNNGNGIRCELAIEAQLCAAFTRGVAMDPSKWWTPSEYYKTGEICNEYAAFFHPISVSNRAYGFCYDDVNDQSTLVECGNAERFTIDLKW